MPSLEPSVCLDRLVGADHGVLATTDVEGLPHAVPVCFAIVDEVVVVPVDRLKPKSTTDLRRVRNVASTGRAALLVEQWEPDDWSRLWWVRADLRSATLPGATRAAAENALRSRYVQYRTTSFDSLLALSIERLTGWAAQAAE